MFVISAALDSQLSDLLSSVGPFVFYIAIWGLVFSGTAFLVGIFLPVLTGDSLLFAAGLIAATTDNVNIAILAAGVGVAAFLGDQIGFILGRKLGRPYLQKQRSSRMQRAIARTEIAYEKFGWFSVTTSRFIPVMRAVIPVIAGVAKMNYYKFLSANLVSAIVWGCGMPVVGYYAASIPAVKNAAYVIAAVFISATLFVSFRAWYIERKETNV
jgi:membrane-associated protein